MWAQDIVEEYEKRNMEVPKHFSDQLESMSIKLAAKVSKTVVKKETKKPEPVIPFFFHFADKALKISGHADYMYFSNWCPSKFVAPEGTFYAMEQYIMYRKAKLFKDKASAKKILESVKESDMLLPNKEWNAKMAAVKKMGRQVENFTVEEWSKNVEEIAVTGLTMKFKQNPKMLKTLKSTGSSILVEAAPRDRIWGVGVGYDKAKNPENWRGKNLLGKFLMKTRDSL